MRVFLLLLFFPLVTLAVDTYKKENRVQYIRNVLLALENTSFNTLDNVRKYVDVVGRNQCRSTFLSLKVECLISASRRNCNEKRTKSRKQKCHLYSDILMINRLSEKRFLTNRERYDIMKKHRKDYKQKIYQELMYRYASLVTEFSLSEYYHEKKDRLGKLKKLVPGFLAPDIDLELDPGEQKEFLANQETYKTIWKQREQVRELASKKKKQKATMLPEPEPPKPQFVPKDDSEKLAFGIDGYCSKKADHGLFSWQACVGAMSWFIGSSK